MSAARQFRFFALNNNHRVWSTNTLQLHWQRSRSTFEEPSKLAKYIYLKNNFNHTNKHTTAPIGFNARIRHKLSFNMYSNEGYNSLFLNKIFQHKNIFSSIYVLNAIALGQHVWCRLRVVCLRREWHNFTIALQECSQKKESLAHELYVVFTGREFGRDTGDDRAASDRWLRRRSLGGRERTSSSDTHILRVWLFHICVCG